MSDKLHRIHCWPQASRLQFDDHHWRAEGKLTTSAKGAIAHRLAVCWNVCEGIPTEELEKGYLRELTNAVFRGDLEAAKAWLTKLDEGTDTTDDRLHDCPSCIGNEALDSDPDDTEYTDSEGGALPVEDR